MSGAFGGLVDRGAEYEVYAFEYATRLTSTDESYFRNPLYGEGNQPFTMGYYFWPLVGGGKTYLVDTGYSLIAATRRGRDFLITPVEALRAFGLDPASVDRVLLTHLHYDHTGNVRAFPNASVSLDHAEYHFWTQGHGRKPMPWGSAEDDDIEHLIDVQREGRLMLLDGTSVVAPGVKAVRVGGHTPGQQVITVNTASGPVVLASDAVHYYDEMALDRPFSLFTDLSAMYDAYELLRNLEGEGAQIIAGHDRDVPRRYGTLEDQGLPFVTRIA